MKKTFLLDILFIVVCACIFIFLYKKEVANIIIAYQIIFLLIAYFFGKYVGKLEIRKKIDRKQEK